MSYYIISPYASLISISNAYNFGLTNLFKIFVPSCFDWFDLRSFHNRSVFTLVSDNNPTAFSYSFTDSAKRPSLFSTSPRALYSVARAYCGNVAGANRLSSLFQSLRKAACCAGACGCPVRNSMRYILSSISRKSIMRKCCSVSLRSSFTDTSFT